jgi:hypothetical protein
MLLKTTDAVPPTTRARSSVKNPAKLAVGRKERALRGALQWRKSNSSRLKI